MYVYGYAYAYAHVFLHLHVYSPQDVLLDQTTKKAIHNVPSCTYKRKLTELKNDPMPDEEKKKIASIAAKDARVAETEKRIHSVDVD